MFTGEFQGIHVGAGPAFSRGGTGVVADVGLRASTVLFLGDGALDYRLALPAEGPVTHQALAAIHLHPLFPFLFGADRPSVALASAYLRLGLGGQAVDADAASDRFAWIWELAGGVDVPVSFASEHAGWWLGLLVGRTLALTDDPFEGEGITLVTLRAAYRSHGPW